VALWHNLSIIEAPHDEHTTCITAGNALCQQALAYAKLTETLEQEQQLAELERLATVAHGNGHHHR
jgi:hypothetical protein